MQEETMIDDWFLYGNGDSAVDCIVDIGLDLDSQIGEEYRRRIFVDVVVVRQ